MTLGNGKLIFHNDFLGVYNDVVWGTGTLVAPFGGEIAFTSVNEGSFASTVDESGGILDILTDTGDDDNACLFAGPFAPRDGKIWLNARFKYSSLTCAIFVGFTQTLSLTTPVMPAEFATATMTYNGTGGMTGLQYDVDGTTDDWRAVMGDGGAAISDSGAGIRANVGATGLTVDRWVEVHIALNEDGTAELYLGTMGNANSVKQNRLKLVKKFSAGTLLDPNDLFFACLMLENRTGAAVHFEVDLFEGGGGRDWRYD